MRITESTVIPKEPKTLTGSGQKGTQPDASTGCLVHTDTKAAGVEVGTKSLVSFKRNKVSPLLRPFGAGVAARHVAGAAGKGCWRKRMPLCNGADRGCDITPLRKQADFQLVVDDERTYRIFAGGNRK